MGDLASDVIATYDLIEQAANKLRKMDPGHKLLKFARPVLEKERWTQELWTEYLEEFATNEKTTIFRAMINYLLALEKALGKR